MSRVASPPPPPPQQSDARWIQYMPVTMRRRIQERPVIFFVRSHTFDCERMTFTFFNEIFCNLLTRRALSGNKIIWRACSINFFFLIYGEDIDWIYKLVETFVCRAQRNHCITIANSGISFWILVQPPKMSKMLLVNSIGIVFPNFLAFWAW